MRIAEANPIVSSQANFTPALRALPPGRTGRAAIDGTAPTNIAPPERTDKTDFNSDTAAVSLQKVDALRSLFPGVRVEVAGLYDEQAIQQYAMQTGGGLHIVLAPDFVDWMFSSPEASSQGKQILTETWQALMEELSSMSAAGKLPLGAGIVIGENGSYSIYTAGEQEKKAPEEDPAGTLKEMLDKANAAYEGVFGRLKVKKKANYCAAREAYALAHVSTERDVKKIISRTYGNMYALKAGKRNYASGVVEQTVKQMETIIARARTKIKALRREEEMERMRKRAEETKQKRKAEALRQELKKRRALRAVREHALIHEFDNPFPGRRMDGRLDEDERPLTPEGSSAAVSGTAEGAAAAPAVSVGGPMPAGTAVTVQSISISG